MANRTVVLREGATAGLLGAAGVALWFFVADLVQGQPLFTPGLLGKAMLSVLGHGIDEPLVFNVAAYTVLHVGAFIGVGLLASALARATERMPQVAVGLLLLFAVFQLGFYFVAAALSQTAVIGAIAWYQILAANVVASGLMGTYLWRRHPALTPALRHSLQGSV